MSEPSKRVAYSPAEFAAQFGKSQTWGYRQIYAGKVKAISKYGRILIPAAEVERVLASAGRYEGMRKNSVKRKTQSAWQAFVDDKRHGEAKGAEKRAVPTSATGKPASRTAALRRLGRKA